MKRGVVSKKSSSFLGFWLPDQYVVALDQAVRAGDTDRSKLIRAAIKEKLERTGMPVPTTAEPR